MRIGINAMYFIPQEIDGIGIYYTRLLQHLLQVSPQDEFFLFVCKESKDFFRDIPRNLQVIVLPVAAENRLLRVLAEQFLLPFLVRKQCIDLLHSVAFSAPLFIPCPSVVSVPDLGFRHWANRFSNFSATFQSLLFSFVAQRASHIITISEFAKREIVSELKVPAYKVSVTYLAHNRSLLCSGENSHETVVESLKKKYNIAVPYILTIASFLPHKNLDGLIRAFGLVIARRQIPHQLVLVGHMRKSLKQIVDEIKAQHLEDRVVLTGFVPDNDLGPIYSLADAFIFPSFYEGFGIPPLEAMACGTPVICSNAASLPEVVGDAALLVDPYDIESVAESISKVLTDQSLRAYLTKCGLERVQHFSWEKTALQTMEVYKQVLII